jgi:hypothetical protein
MSAVKCKLPVFDSVPNIYESLLIFNLKVGGKNPPEKHSNFPLSTRAKWALNNKLFTILQSLKKQGFSYKKRINNGRRNGWCATGQTEYNSNQH